MLRPVELLEDRSLLASTPVISLSATPPSSIDEGDSLTVAGTASHTGTEDIDVYIRWYDSGPSGSTSASSSYSDYATIAPGGSFSFSQLYGDDGEYTVSLWASVTEYSFSTGSTSVTSGSTSMSGSTSTSMPTSSTSTVTHVSSPLSYSLDVDNVAPTLNITDPAGSSISVVQGQYLNLSGSVSDPGFDTLSLNINWDDGTGSSSGGSNVFSGSTFNYSHSWFNTGTYSVSLTLSDDDGGTDSRNLTVNVTQDDPPTISSVTWPAGKEGYDQSTGTSGFSSYGVVLQASITDNNNAVSRVVIDWGDGQTDSYSSLSGSTSMSGSLRTWYHAYGDHGILNTSTSPATTDDYTVTLTAYDNFGNPASVTGFASLSNEDPTLSVAEWPDPASTSTSMTGTPTTSATLTTSATATTGSTSSPWTVVVGETVPLTLSGSDPGWLDDLTVTVEWEHDAGGSTSSSPTSVPYTGPAGTLTGVGSLSGGLSHVYAASGLFSVRVAMNDGDGATVQKDRDINVIPEVSVEATDDKATELTDKTGEFTITRNDSNLTDPLPVKLSLSGSADEGTEQDYVLSGGGYAPGSSTVTIPAGESSVAITVDPEQESPNSLEPNETVRLTLETLDSDSDGKDDYAIKTATDTVVVREGPELIDLEVSGTAVELNDGANLPSPDTTDVVVAPIYVPWFNPRADTHIEIVPKFDETVNVASPPDGFTVEWSGAIPIPGTLKAQYSRKISDKGTVTAQFGGSTYKLLIYVVAANVTGFKGGDGSRGQQTYTTSETFADNSKSQGPGGGGTGLLIENTTTGEFQTYVEVQYSVTPMALIDDGNDGHFAKGHVIFGFHRQRASLRYRYADNHWEPSGAANKPNEWVDDGYSAGRADDDEDADPWDSQWGHIYDGDRPGNGSNPQGTDWFYADNLREWTELTIRKDGRTALIPTPISTDRYKWHSIASVGFNGGALDTENIDRGSDAGPGNIFWPELPQDITDLLVTYTVPSGLDASNLQSVEGQAYSLDIQLALPEAADSTDTLALSVAEGSLPPGLTYSFDDNTNVLSISGTPSISPWDGTILFVATVDGTAAFVDARISLTFEVLTPPS